jgi:DeoR/GlpR family transcriptional regulator of sugar metabolism
MVIRRKRRSRGEGFDRLPRVAAQPVLEYYRQSHAPCVVHIEDRRACPGKLGINRSHEMKPTLASVWRRNSRENATSISSSPGITRGPLNPHCLQQGLLKRTHGGALSIRAPGERDLMTRFVQNVEAKRAIGRACCDLIEEGEAVFLDCGTTMHHFAQQLATRRVQLTVLTNSPSIAECLADVGGITHILLGGQMRRKSGGISGPLALEIIERFSIATAFIGASGITEEAITVADFNEAQLKAAIIKRTQRVIVPIDHSKIGVVDFTRVCEPRDIDIVVTDYANDHLRRVCRDHEIKLEEASAKASE